MRHLVLGDGGRGHDGGGRKISKVQFRGVGQKWEVPKENLHWEFTSGLCLGKEVLVFKK